MPTTPRGLVYPDSAAHTRLWDHIHDLATSIETAMDALVPPGAWQTYTPVWTGSTTNPAIGNGTLSGRYRLLGAKHLDVRINIIFGTTTTYGSGSYAVSLPFTSHATGRQTLQGDWVGAAGTLFARARVEPSTAVAAIWVPGTVAGGVDRTMTNAIPAGQATGGQIVLAGTLELA